MSNWGFRTLAANFRLAPSIRLAPAVAAALFLLGREADAAAWARPSGELLTITRADAFRGDLDPAAVNGDRVVGRLERISVDSYLEYGLTDVVTIGGKVIYGASRFTQGDSRQTQSGFSEISGFAQLQVHRSAKRAAALKLELARPASGQSGVRPALFSEGVDVEIAALYGRDLIAAPVKVFSTLEVGGQARFGAAADQIRFKSALGVEPHRRLMVLLETLSSVSLRNARAGGADFDVVRFEPSLVWRFTDRWSLEAGFTKEIHGRNIALGRTVFLGLWTTF